MKACQSSFSALPLVRAFLIVFLGGSLASPAAITVDGIADEDIENDDASFTVPSEAGFTIVALLDDAPVALDTNVVVTTPGYYELAVTKTNNSDQSEESVVIQFIVLDTSRGTSERGLVNWVPYPTIDSASGAFAGAHLEVIVPSALPLGFEIPLVARLADAGSGNGLRLNGTLKIAEAPGHSVRLLRGFGSGFLPAPGPGTTNLTPVLHGLGRARTVEIEPATTWTTISADITSNTDWGTNARVHITGDLVVSDAATLTIGAGSVVQLDPGVDIELDGLLVINGTVAAPVLFTNVPGEDPWGGFFLQGANSQVTATGAIFTGSGADDNWFSGSGYSSHRSEQATFLFDDTGGSFTDCFFLDLAGQALHGRDGSVELTGCLVQRVPTVGQFNGGDVTVTRSALIEFPSNDNIFADDDNDGIYFTVGTHHLIDTVIGWAKDDGVDAGSGSSGNVTVSGSWFEACYHEGMAWSGGGRTATVSGSVVMNCGQGIEAGFSDSANSPLVNVTGSLCIANHVGWRYGDNYDWDYDGQLNVSGSLSLYNDRNVWGYEWDSWNYRSEMMTIENNKLSAPDSRHPANTVWDGPADAALLAPLAPAPGAPAGCGFGEWSFQRPAADYGEDVTLSLSEFSTQPVTIDYVVARDFTVIGSGTVEFMPGELRKKLAVPALDTAPQQVVRVTLTGASGGEVTTPRNLFYLATPGVADGPQTLVARGSEWRYLDDGSDQMMAWREVAFDESGWKAGQAELGYGDDDEATTINDRNTSGQLIATTYFRHTFSVTNPAQFGTLDVNLLRDDGAIAYLNGAEVFRSNIDDGPIAFDEYSGNVTSGSDEEVYYSTTIPASKLLDGTNVVAVEVHQANDSSSDVSFDLELVARPPTPLVFVLVKSGGQLNLLWQGDPGLILQSSTDLETDWADLPGASSPMILTPGQPDPRKFFRLVR